MSRNIDLDIIEQLESNELTPVCLLDFADDGYLYQFCDLDVPLYLDTTMSGVTISGTYMPLGFKFDSIKYSLGSIVDQAVVTVDNVDQAMTSVFVDGVTQGEAASIHIAVLDTDDDVIAIATIFAGEVDSWELDENTVRITITSLFTRWNNKTTSLHSASCRWKDFKGKSDLAARAYRLSACPRVADHQRTGERGEYGHCSSNLRRPMSPCHVVEERPEQHDNLGVPVDRRVEKGA